MSEIDQLRAEMMREFGKLNRKADTMIQLAERVSNRQLASDARTDNHAGRLRAVELETERRSAAEPGPDWRAETTGSYDLKRLVETERKRDSDARHLKRQVRGWVVRGVGAVLLVLFAAYVTAKVAGSTQPPTVQPR